MSADVSNLVEDYLSVVRTKDDEIFHLVEENRRLLGALDAAERNCDVSAREAESWKGQCDALRAQLQHEAARADEAEQVNRLLRQFSQHAAGVVRCEIADNANLAELEADLLRAQQSLDTLIVQSRRIAPRAQHMAHFIDKLCDTGAVSVMNEETDGRLSIRDQRDTMLRLLKAVETSAAEKIQAQNAHRSTYLYLRRYVESDDPGSVTDSPAGADWAVSYEKAAADAYAALTALRIERDRLRTDLATVQDESHRLSSESDRVNYEGSLNRSGAQLAYSHTLRLVVEYQSEILALREMHFGYPLLHKFISRCSTLTTTNEALEEENKKVKENLHRMMSTGKARVNELEEMLGDNEADSNEREQQAAATIAELKGKVADLIGREAALRRHVKAAESDYHREIDEIREHTSNMNSSMASIDAERANIAAALRAAQNEVKGVRTQLASAERQKSELHQTLSDLETTLAASQRDAAEKRGEIVALKQQLIQRDEAVDATEADCARRLKRQEAAAQEQAAKMKQQVAEANERAANGMLERDAELSELKSRIHALVDVHRARELELNDEADMQFRNLKAANDGLRDVNDKLKSELSRATAELQEKSALHETEVKSLRSLVERTEVESIRRQEELRHFTDTNVIARERDELQRKVGELELACEISVRHVTELREALQLATDGRGPPSSSPLQQPTEARYGSATSAASGYTPQRGSRIGASATSANVVTSPLHVSGLSFVSEESPPPRRELGRM